MVVGAIAYNTFRETVRDKILYAILLFALGFALVSAIISQWSMGQESKILQDFALTIITVFGLLIAVFMSINIVFKEMEKRTIYTILAKPISRGQFIAGKYLGLILTLVVNFVLMCIGFIAIIWIFTGMLNPKIALAIGMIFWQMAIMIAVTLFFSTCTSFIVSAVLSLFVYLAGNFSADIIVLGSGVENMGLYWLLKIVYYIIPNFSLLNINNYVVHSMPLSFEKIALGVVYSIVYCSLLILFAAALFKRHNLK